MPSDPNATWRVRIAFVSLFVVFAVGIYFIADLRKLQEGMAVRERQAASQAATEPKQIDEALRQHPQDRLLQTIAMAEGLDQLANLQGVVVFRQVGGKRMAAVFDLAAVRAGKAEDPVIYGDDVVVVEQ